MPKDLTDEIVETTPSKPRFPKKTLAFIAAAAVTTAVAVMVVVKSTSKEQDDEEFVPDVIVESLSELESKTQ